MRLIRKMINWLSKEELMDFYFSAKQADVYREMNRNGAFDRIQGFHKQKAFARGKLYTQCTSSGSKLHNHFDDNKFVCTGTRNDITFKGYF